MSGDSFIVFVEGLKDIQEFSMLEEHIALNVVRAINRTTEKARTSGARKMRALINFPASYLQPAAKRFYVSKYATRSKPEAIIRARGRPTSLARFVSGYTPGKEGVNIQVKTGRTQRLKRAFLIRLRAGAAQLDTKNNMGLAVRLGKGQTLRNKKNVVKMKNGLYLLYGPSIDQVFLNSEGSGVLEEITPEVLENMEDEFLRLMDTL